VKADLLNILTVLWRWSWLIITLAVVAGGAAWLNISRTPPSYMSWVTLQITSPDNSGISMMDEYSYRNDRDEVTIALNNFRLLLESNEVAVMTNEILGFEPEYDMEVRSQLDSDLVYVNVTAADPNLAAEIAGARVNAALGYFGEVRSRAARESYTHFQAELATNLADLATAETALSQFLLTHNLAGTLETELELQRTLLNQLEVERSRLLLDGVVNEPARLAALELSLLRQETALQEQQLERLQLERSQLVALPSTTNDNAGTLETETETETETEGAEGSAVTTVADLDLAIYEAEQRLQAMLLRQIEAERGAQEEELQRLQEGGGNTAVLTHLDTLIATQRAKIQSITALQPEYNQLNTQIRQLRDTITLINRKLTETAQKESFASQVFFIQLIAGPSIPPEPISQSMVTPLLISIIAGLGLGVIIAFGFEYLRHWKPSTHMGMPSSANSSSPHPTQTNTPLDQIKSSS
jgi:uncharacterized protein involved in exopolysaccharide biosynthesis